MQNLGRLPLFLLLIGFPLLSPACIWDDDTIEMEAMRFPGTNELLTGRFLQHSAEFHYWRYRNRETRLIQDPDNLELIDDLAVSLDKLGRDEEAIRWIKRSDSLDPCRYETYANWGTFLIHSGKYEEGLEKIKTAIEINPDAHFGREIYQQYVVEYVMSKMKNGKIPRPLVPVGELTGINFLLYSHQSNFYAFLLGKFNGKRADEGKDTLKSLPDAELRKAIKGVRGMMKFGNYNSPVLLEVLGDLLLGRPDMVQIDREKPYKTDPSRHLAGRAYLLSAGPSTDPRVQAACKIKAATVLSRVRGGKFNGLYLQEAMVSLELDQKEGEHYRKDIADHEIAWIKGGQDPDHEFKAKYYKEEDKVKEGKRRRDRRPADKSEIAHMMFDHDFKATRKDTLRGRNYQAWQRFNPHPVQIAPSVVQTVDSLFPTEANRTPRLFM